MHKLACQALNGCPWKPGRPAWHGLGPGAQRVCQRQVAEQTAQVSWQLACVQPAPPLQGARAPTHACQLLRAAGAEKQRLE